VQTEEQKFLRASLKRAKENIQRHFFHASVRECYYCIHNKNPLQIVRIKSYCVTCPVKEECKKILELHSKIYLSLMELEVIISKRLVKVNKAKETSKNVSHSRSRTTRA
jgi:hypothetical protein